MAGNVSRAKDPKIVKEAQKPILIAKQIMGGLAFLLTFLFARYNIWFIEGPIDFVMSQIFG